MLFWLNFQNRKQTNQKAIRHPKCHPGRLPGHPECQREQEMTLGSISYLLLTVLFDCR